VMLGVLAIRLQGLNKALGCPRWLFKSGRREESLKVLTRIGGESLANVEILEIAESLKENTSSISFGEMLGSKFLVFYQNPLSCFPKR